ncbi:MAG: S41 family peptidase [Saprospiraceae bacterium]
MFKAQKRPSWFIWLPLAGAGLLVVGLLVGVTLEQSAAPAMEITEVDDNLTNSNGIGSIEEILRYIEAKYVDDVDREAIVDGAVNNLLAELDPHSSYISPTKLAAHKEQLNGTTTGIGVDVLMIRDSVTIVSAIPESPASKAGVQPYDRIISIADSIVSGDGRSLSTVKAILKSLPKGAIQLQVYRPGEGELLPVTVSPSEMIVPTVSEGILLDKEVAYVHIRQFATDTYQQFMQQVERLVQDSAAKHLVIDLRGNSGGYLQEAVNVLSQLFPEEGQLMVFTEGEHSPRKDYNASGRVFFSVENVSVIIDNGTASASEILAGAVQDWDRGVVVGERSFGKGLVQELYPLKNGGALHITVARYFTPSGRSIQRDYEDLGAYRAGFDSLDQLSPKQYVTAAGRSVFSGSGISPDIEVAAVSHIAEPNFGKAREVLDHFVFEGVETANSGTSIEDLLSDYQASLKANGITFNSDQWSYYRNEVEAEIRIALRRKTEGQAAANRLRLGQDPFVQEALKAVLGTQLIARQNG